MSSRFASLLCCLTLASACAPRLSIEQKRAMTTRVINASVEDVFRATVTVIQDEGYSITDADLEGGLIRAFSTADLDPGLRMLAGASFALQALGVHFGDEPEEGDETEVPERMDAEVTAVVTPRTDGATELRIMLHRTEHVTVHTVGEDEVEAVTKPETVYDPEIFRPLFNSIVVEVERRRAIRSLTDSTGVNGGLP